MKLKRIICTLISASMLFSTVSLAAVNTNLRYADAVAGAVAVSADMVYETEASVTKQQLVNALFDYENNSDNSLGTLRNALDADFTLYFGEDNAKNINLVRMYVYGSDDDEHNPPVTVYGSNDGNTWTELAIVASPLKGAWNEESVDADSAYSYIKVESEMTETEDDEIDDEGALTEGETLTYHQRISSIAFFAEGEEDENEGGSGSGGSVSGSTNARFSDIDGHWAQEEIEKYVDMGVLSGYEDGTFRPDNGVSVAEFCRIVSAIKGINYKISDGHWALPYIREMMGSGVIERADYEDYNAVMTREQVAKSVTALMSGEYYPKDLTQFAQYITDANEIDANYNEYVIKSYISGVLSGYEDGSWKPQRGVTRAEILSVMDRTFDKNARVIPDALSNISTDSPEQAYYYTAAVQIRKNSSTNGMQYRLYGSGAQYMEENDDATGLKMANEIQGAQGFAMVVRYDISDIVKKKDKLEKLYVDANWSKGGTVENELGLWFYTNEADKTDWNNSLYMRNLNGNAVAGEDLSGYNSVTTNISAVLPTFGNTSNAVPNDKKTQPLAHSARDESGRYVFDITALYDEIIAHANDNNMVEFIITTVNYDDYGQEDDKPNIFLAGEKAPKLNAEYKVSENQ